MNSERINTKNQANPKQKSNTLHLSVMQNLPGLNISIGHFLPRRALFIVCFLVCTPFLSRAESDTETLNEISTVSNIYVQELMHNIADLNPGSFEYSIASPSSTQKLFTCASPIQVKPLSDAFISGRFVLKVYCTSPNPWSVSLPGELKHFLDIVVSARPLNRGEIITKHDLQWKKIASKLVRPGYSMDKESLIGYEIKRSLQVNQPIKPSHITPPLMIKKGQHVSITAQLNRLKVKSSGIALSNGTLGQVILVKNRKTKRVIEATILAPGKVMVRL
ncbi:MAG: flagella basal body P-ring formation protein FlgA [Moraxellaceae bacterium]|nr:MAG: flagella basal body P-ring formation protein FlgA [Moraxellaceae bacterium]